MAGLALLGLLTTLPLRGQNPAIQTYPPFEPTEAYYQATSEVTEGDRQKGLSMLLQLAAANPNTSLGATSLFTAAAYSGAKLDAANLYQRILSEYPRSRFEIQARQGLANQQAQSPAEWLALMEPLVSSYGAPKANEIVANNARAGARLLALPLEYQRAFVQHYEFLCAVLQNSKRASDSAAICQFGMDYVTKIDPDTRSYFVNYLHGAFDDLGLNYHTRMPYINPEVRVRSPKGQAKGPRPKVRLDVVQRELFLPLIDLESSTFELDGQNVRPQVEVLKHSINPTPKKKQTYERLRLAFRPAQPLSKGSHVFTAFIVVDGYKPGGPGATRVTVRWGCTRDRDDDEDGDGDDDAPWDDE